MWVVLNDSFLSIVADKNDPAKLLVRARVAGDIERVFPDAKVTRTLERDYAFRASVERSHVALRLSSRIGAINYTNFKDSVSEDWRHNAYLRIWRTMYQVQEWFLDQHVKRSPNGRKS